MKPREPVCPPLAECYRFPGGKHKALVMSYDDGSEHDRRLVEIFNRFRIKGTFNLNSGKLSQPHHVAAHEVQTLYQGHEVACHTVNHPDLTALSDADIRHEITQDRIALEGLAGKPVRGLAYPFGTYDERIVEFLPELGITYARTANSTQDFQLPQTFAAWQPTAHHQYALLLGEQFLRSDNHQPQVLSIWGHSYEFDGFMTADIRQDWRYMETVCDLLHDQDALYYATTIELMDYVKALRQMTWSPLDNELKNYSPSTLWLDWHGELMEVASGDSVVLT